MRSALLAVLLAGGLAAEAQTVPTPFSFSRLPQTLPGLVAPTLRWADVDGDGDLDLLAAGTRLPVQPGETARAVTTLYRNDGAAPDPAAPGRQTVAFADVGAPLVALTAGDAGWADVDRDGDPDLVVAGSTTPAPPYAPATRLYRNDGGRLVEAGPALPGRVGGVVRWADVDGDGDPDLLLTGAAETRAPYTPTATLLRNDAGTLTPVESGLPGVAFGDARFLDADSDGDPDLLLAGLTATGLDAALYRNDGQGRFTRAAARAGLAAATLDATTSGAGTRVAFGGGRPSVFYLDGALGVDALQPTGFAPVATLEARVGGAVAWGDLDGDGDADLAAAGGLRFEAGRGLDVYRAENAGFVLQDRLVGLSGGTLVWGDVDGDGDLDLAAAGAVAPGIAETILYRNDRFGRSVPPDVPDPVASTTPDGRPLLTWVATPGASYDVWIGSAMGQADVVAPEADRATGFRRLATAGPLAGGRYEGPALPPGTYHYGVQAVSGERVGSAFATGTVVVGTATAGGAAEGAGPLALWAPTGARGDLPVRFTLPAAGHARLAVVDVLGRTVALLADGPLAAGVHARTLQSGPLAPGTYFLHLATPAGTRTRAVVRLR